MPKPTRLNISEVLMEYQLSLIGKSVKDAVNTQGWKEEWYITPAQMEQFQKYAIPLIKKVFKCSKGNAVDTLNFFISQFGLKLKP